MELEVKNIQGKGTGRKVQLSDAVFGLQDPQSHLVWLDVRLIQANAHQGTHKTKERGEVSGSTRKPFRQKGTGGARAGHKRSPLWRHGGTVFGPRVRDYGFKLNKKTKSLARAAALTYKAQANKIQVVEDFSFAAPKTKDFLKVMESLGIAGKKVLFVLGGESKNVYLSGRNIAKTKISRAADLNTLEVLHADSLVIFEPAVQVIENNIIAN